MACLSDQVSGGEMPSEVIMAAQQRCVGNVVDAGERDQEKIDSETLDRCPDHVWPSGELTLTPARQRVHQATPQDRREPSQPRLLFEPYDGTADLRLRK